MKISVSQINSGSEVNELWEGRNAGRSPQLGDQQEASKRPACQRVIGNQ